MSTSQFKAVSTALARERIFAAGAAIAAHAGIERDPAPDANERRDPGLPEVRDHELLADVLEALVVVLDRLDPAPKQAKRKAATKTA